MWSCEERVFKYKGRPFFRSYSPPAHWHIQPFNTPLLSSTCLSYTLPLSDFKSVQSCLLQPIQSLPTLLLQPSLLQAKNWISAYLKGAYFRPLMWHLKTGHPLKLRLLMTPGCLTTQINPADTLPTVYLFSNLVIIKRGLSQKHQPNLSRTWTKNTQSIFLNAWAITNKHLNLKYTVRITRIYSHTIICFGSSTTIWRRSWWTSWWIRKRWLINCRGWWVSRVRRLRVRKGRLRVRKGSWRDMNTVLERGITLEAAKTEEWFGDSEIL